MVRQRWVYFYTSVTGAERTSLTGGDQCCCSYFPLEVLCLPVWQWDSPRLWISGFSWIVGLLVDGWIKNKYCTGFLEMVPAGRRWSLLVDNYKSRARGLIDSPRGLIDKLLSAALLECRSDVFLWKGNTQQAPCIFFSSFLPTLSVCECWVCANSGHCTQHSRKNKTKTLGNSAWQNSPGSSSCHSRWAVWTGLGCLQLFWTFASRRRWSEVMSVLYGSTVSGWGY